MNSDLTYVIILLGQNNYMRYIKGISMFIVCNIVILQYHLFLKTSNSILKKRIVVAVPKCRKSKFGEIVLFPF